jgi:D-sedoheptulose 7-phosphate isomerase
MLEHIAQRTATLSSGLIEISERLGPTLAQVSAQLTQTLLTEGRILTCGVGQQAALAQMFSTQLNHKLNQDRPALPSICLNADAVLVSSIASGRSGSEVYAHQIRAMAQPQDLLVLFSENGSEPACMKALSSAHDRDIGCIIISDESGGELSALIGHEDQEIRLPSQEQATLLPMQLAVSTLLLELIEKQLFG